VLGHEDQQRATVRGEPTDGDPPWTGPAHIQLRGRAADGTGTAESPAAVGGTGSAGGHGTAAIAAVCYPCGLHRSGSTAAGTPPIPGPLPR
jgi:hypothetical protein